VTSPSPSPPGAGANDILRAWSRSAPKTGGYDKCDFIIVFEDGQCTTADTTWSIIPSSPRDLAKHVRQFIQCLVSTPPSWMRDEPDVLKRYSAEIAASPERTNEACRWLATYDLGR
jgi:hypothetical protein